MSEQEERQRRHVRAQKDEEKDEVEAHRKAAANEEHSDEDTSDEVEGHFHHRGKV